MGIFIAVAPNIFSGQNFIPDAGSRVAAIDVIQVIAVAAERVAEFCLARQLNGGAARDEEQVFRRAGNYTIPHLLLVIMVTRVGGMFGITAIRPGLHPAYLRVGLIGPDGVNKER